MPAMSYEPVRYMLPWARVDRAALEKAAQAAVKQHKGTIAIEADPDAEEEAGNFAGRIVVGPSNGVIDVFPGDDELKAYLEVDVDAPGEAAQVLDQLAAEIAEQLGGHPENEHEGMEWWADTQDTMPLPTWPAVAAYVRGEFALDVLEGDWLAFTHPTADGARDQMVRIASDGDSNEPWIALASTICPESALAPTEALEENTTGWAALCLNDGDYELTYSFPLEALTGARLKRLLARFAEAADELERTYTSGGDEY
jgi:hypothetical protein